MKLLRFLMIISSLKQKCYSEESVAGSGHRLVLIIVLWEQNNCVT